MTADEAAFTVGVACGTGPAGDAVPRRLVIGGRSVDVVEVLDRWPGADHLYVKLRGSDGAVYILRQDPGRGFWQLILFERGAGRGDPGGQPGGGADQNPAGNG